MNTPQNSPLGVQQVTLVPVAPESILSKISMGASTSFPVIPQVKTKLLASSVRCAASVRSWESQKIRDQTPCKVRCQTQFLEGHCPAEFSSNLNLTYVKQLIKCSRITGNLQAGNLELVGAKLCRPFDTHGLNK